MSAPLSYSDASTAALSHDSAAVSDIPPARPRVPVTFLAPIRAPPPEPNEPVDSIPNVEAPPELRRWKSANALGNMRRCMSRKTSWISSLARASSRIVRHPKKENVERPANEVFSFRTNPRGTTLAASTRLAGSILEQNIASGSLNSVDTDIQHLTEWTTSEGDWNVPNASRVEGTSRDLERSTQHRSGSIWRKRKAADLSQAGKRSHTLWDDLRSSRVGTLLRNNRVSRTLSRGKRWIERITQDPENEDADFERSFEYFIRSEASRPRSTVNIISGAEDDIISIPLSQFSSDEESHSWLNTETHTRNVQTIMRDLAFDAAAEEDLLSISEDAASIEFHDVPSFPHPTHVNLDAVVEVSHREVTDETENTLPEIFAATDDTLAAADGSESAGFAAVVRPVSVGSSTLYAGSQVGTFSSREHSASAGSRTRVASIDSDDIQSWSIHESNFSTFPLGGRRHNSNANFSTVYSSASAGSRTPVSAAANSHPGNSTSEGSQNELVRTDSASSTAVSDTSSLGQRINFTRRLIDQSTEHDIVAIAVEHADPDTEWHRNVVVIAESDVFEPEVAEEGSSQDDDSVLERIRDHALFEHLDEIDDLVEKYRQDLFEHPMWESTEILLRQVESFTGHSQGAGNSLLGDTESDIVSTQTSSVETIPDYTTAFDELAALTLNNGAGISRYSVNYDADAELNSLGDHSESRIDLVREEALFRQVVGGYRRVFFNLITKMVMPGGYKIREEIREIMRFRKIAWDLLVGVASLNREVSEIGSQVDQCNEVEFSRLPIQLDASESALESMEQTHKRVLSRLSQFELYSHFDIRDIVGSIRNIRTTRDRILERYNLFHMLNDSHAGFGLHSIHRVTHMLEYKKMTNWHYQLDTQAFCDLLWGDIKVLSTVCESIDEMFRSVHENIGSVRNVIELYGSI